MIEPGFKTVKKEKTYDYHLWLSHNGVLIEKLFCSTEKELAKETLDLYKSIIRVSFKSFNELLLKSIFDLEMVRENVHMLLEEPFVEMEINEFTYILYDNRLCFITDIEYHGNDRNSIMYVFYDCETRHIYKQTISRITPLDLKVYTKLDRYVELKTTHHYGIIMQTDEKEENYVVDIGIFPIYISSDQVEKIVIRDREDSIIRLGDFVKIDSNLKLKYSNRYGMVEHFQYYNNVGGNVLYHIAFGNSTYYYQPDYVEKINVKEK